MATVTEIPLSSQNESFQVTMANVIYRMKVTWRDPYGWFLDIANAAGTKLISGLPLVAGHNLLQPYPEFQFGCGLVVLTDGDIDADPTYTNLGLQSRLYIVVP